VTSRRFRDKPFGVMFGSEDALQTLRDTPPEDAETRSRMIRKLKEPLKAGLGQDVQDEVMQTLSNEATQSKSAWMRVSAIEALTRFEDPRRIEILANAYHYANGKPGATTGAESGSVKQVKAENPVLSLASFYTTKGFAPDQVANIRCRAIEGLAKANDPQAVEFLARIAEGREFGVNEDPTSKDYVRQRAVDGLGKIRHKEAVVALQKVLAAESGRDVALTSIAHQGLKDLTGKNAPADPEQWNAIVQAGVDIRPEPSGVMRAVSEIID
jgi:HEAT repeat protein